MRYCNKLCNGSYIHKDLYQEFFLVIDSEPTDKLKGMYDRKEIDFYCLTVIWMLWRNVGRLTFKKDSNPLLNISDIHTEFNQNTKLIRDNYNHKIDLDFIKVMDYLKNDESISCEDFLILTESIDKKLIDISRETNIPYITLKTKRKRIKDKIIKNVNI